MALHDNLKAARKRIGLSQEMVAERLDISRQAVTKWELGQSKPSARNLQALAELYQISSEELLSEGRSTDTGQQGPNLILRANLTKLALILQTAFLCNCTVYIRMLRRHVDDDFYRGALIFSLVCLLLASTWATANHRYEPDMIQRRKNVNIELKYCVIQTLISLLTIYSGLGLAGFALIILVFLIYVLYINPRFMNRKLTK